MKNPKKAIIIIVIILFVIGITIGIILWVRSSNKKKELKKAQEAKAQLAILQAQMANPSLSADQRPGILAQIAALADTIKTANANVSDSTITDNPANPMDSLITAALNTASQPQMPPAGFPLKQGSITAKDGPVGKLQIAINRDCKAGIGVDGNLGPKTLAAMKKCYGGKTQVSFTEFQSITAGI